jgi:hypothetical protein
VTSVTSTRCAPPSRPSYRVTSPACQPPCLGKYLVRRRRTCLLSFLANHRARSAIAALPLVPVLMTDADRVVPVVVREADEELPHRDPLCADREGDVRATGGAGWLPGEVGGVDAYRHPLRGSCRRGRAASSRRGRASAVTRVLGAVAPGLRLEQSRYRLGLPYAAGRLAGPDGYRHGASRGGRPSQWLCPDRSWLAHQPAPLGPRQPDPFASW